MVVLPAQKRKQQLLLVALIIVLVLIFIAWFVAFRILNPGQISPPGKEAPLPEGGEPAPPIVIPRLDWDFISLFGTFHVFESFNGEFTTAGRKNPFLPY